MVPVRSLPLLRQVVSSGATHSALYKESTVALSLHSTDAEAAIVTPAALNGIRRNNLFYTTFAKQKVGCFTSVFCYCDILKLHSSARGKDYVD